MAVQGTTIDHCFDILVNFPGYIINTKRVSHPGRYFRTFIEVYPYTSWRSCLEHPEVCQLACKFYPAHYFNTIRLCLNLNCLLLKHETDY